MLNTLNYSEAIEAFSSFVSSEPRWYIDLKGSYYSFNADGKCFLHNAGNDYNRMKDTVTPDRSFIKLLVNDDYEVTKTFDNVSYSADFSPSENIVPLQFKTRLHATDKVDFIDSREDTYKFSIPRDASNNIPGSVTNIVSNGFLYDWHAVNNSSGLAPDGWHIPSISEVQELVEYARNNVGVLSSLFKGDILKNIIWSQTESVDNSEMAFSIAGIYPPTNAILTGTSTKLGWGSTRCIKNDSTYVSKLIDIDGNEYPTVMLGNQIWITKNLATAHYKNGDLIPPKVLNSTDGAVVSQIDSFTTEVIEEYKETFSSRLRGKYMVCDYEFKSNKGYTFRLPYIETTYRYSMI